MGFTRKPFEALQLSNNAAERALRKAALGRKNFLFVGDERCANCPSEKGRASMM